MTLAHCDPFSGASGDMLLGAVVAAGVEPGELTAVLAGLGVPGWTLASSDVLRGGLAATRVEVDVRHDDVERTWADVRELLATADLPQPVRERSLGVFSRLARAEARVHASEVARVRFHEVGAVDAIVDVVGVCAGLHLLGVERVSCGPVALGSGMTSGRHGALPVPPPAVLELLRGAPSMATDVAAELCTPTGAALLAEWVTNWAPQPPMIVRAVGYGAGSRDLERPNVLRLVLGDALAAADGASVQQVLLLETTLDDLPGELVPAVLDGLRAAGASDAWARPVVMKKGRPGLEIACLADPARSQVLRRVLFRETTTLGVRGRLVDKWMLEREWVTVDVAGQPVRLKVGRLDGAAVNVAPEYDDCAAAAAASGLPLKEVYARARSAWRE